MKKLVFRLSLLLAFLPSAAFGDLSQYNIYFINGMDNEPPQADASRRALHDLVLPDVPNSSVQNFYQRNTGSLRQMLDVVRPQALADVQRESYKRFWRCITEPTPEKCDSTDPLAPDIRQIITTTLGNFDERAYVQSAPLQAMVSKLRSNYANGRKSLLVAHSRGTFMRIKL